VAVPAGRWADVSAAELDPRVCSLRASFCRESDHELSRLAPSTKEPEEHERIEEAPRSARAKGEPSVHGSAELDR
jgi:hypothetical protein